MVNLKICQPPMPKGVRFLRRDDLTLEIRLYIAFMALMSDKWGIITEMSKKFAISRTFVYMLSSQLNSAIEDYFYVGSASSKKELMIVEKEKSLEYSLLLRLEVKCSIPAISGMLKKMGMKNASVGTISQNLNQIGKYLPDTFHVDNGAILYVCLAADEMYSYSTPILITVDPVSTAILRIELAESRKTEDWINHFNMLGENGIQVILVVSDEGQGICSATGSALPGVNRQPDTFHAIPIDWANGSIAWSDQLTLPLKMNIIAWKYSSRQKPDRSYRKGWMHILAFFRFIAQKISQQTIQCLRNQFMSQIIGVNTVQE